MNLQTINASASPEVQMNENFEALDWAAVFAKDAVTTNGLTWGYVGGRWGGFPITAGTLALTDAATNYVVVALATGVISVSASSTNWNDGANYARIYKLTTAGGVVTVIEDHRCGPGGVMAGAGGGGGGGAQLDQVQSWTKAQRGTAAALASTAGAIAIDLDAGNNFAMTMTENSTLSAPSHPVQGQSGCIVITQDPTTPRTLAYNAFWKFPGGVVPTLTATAGAVDTFTYYVESATRATCGLLKDVK